MDAVPRCLLSLWYTRIFRSLWWGLKTSGSEETWTKTKGIIINFPPLGTPPLSSHGVAIQIIPLYNHTKFYHYSESSCKGIYTAPFTRSCNWGWCHVNPDRNSCTIHPALWPLLSSPGDGWTAPYRDYLPEQHHIYSTYLGICPRVRLPWTLYPGSGKDDLMDWKRMLRWRAKALDPFLNWLIKVLKLWFFTVR